MQLTKLMSAAALGVALALSSVSFSHASQVNEEKYCSDQDCQIQLRNLSKLAKNGSGRAAAIVAMAYASGDGLELDHEKAKHFITLGVRYKDPVATHLMSDWLRTGFVVEQDVEKADQMLERAVKYEYGPAMYQKALALLQTDEPENATEAVELLELASEKKLMSAMFLLARLKQTGIATEKDLEGAGQLYKALTRAKHPKAHTHMQEVIEEMSGNAQNPELVAELRNVKDVEVIKVSGERFQVNLMLDSLVDSLRASGKFDSRSIGSRIRGVSCAEVSNCGAISPSDSPGASSVLELMSGTQGKR
ncbi:tetratricopeptide repeat protein [Glaciecola sp. 1036]|uniref:tetratricopeptide repeat protein n=1 Tax=Alteromonadaceae TaxID=72275 RepID=UPI003D045685